MIHCLHGAVGTPENWNFLKPHFTTQAPHLWQHLRGNTLSLSQIGQKITSLASQDDILLGYSLGGRIALHALLHEPQKWKAAIIISAHPGLLEGQQARLTSDQKWAKQAASSWEDFLTKWNSQSILSGDSLQQASIENQLEVSKSFQLWSLGKQENLRPRFPEITTPILWLTGQDDHKFTSLANDATPLLPACQHQIFPNCGHRLPWQDQDRFIDAIKSFIGNLSNH